MIVMKFGGRALSSAQRIKEVGRIIRSRLSSSSVIVVSAFSGVTDRLDQLARYAAERGSAGSPPSLPRGGKIASLASLRRYHQKIINNLGLSAVSAQAGAGPPIEPLWKELELALKGITLLRELTPRTRDYVLSFGERFASRVIAHFLAGEGLPAQALDAFRIGLKTDSNFGSAHPLPGSAGAIRKNLAPLLRGKKIPVITGFIGKDRKGEITTLGRDGSDYTASFIGAALGAREIQIWRDLPGIMTGDPAIVKNARLVKAITLNEASELVHYGNGVLHPYMLAPAVAKGIPVRLLNILQPTSTGTLITDKRPVCPVCVRTRTGRRATLTASELAQAGGTGRLDKTPVKAIAYKKDVVLVNIFSPELFYHRGLVGRVFEILRRYGVFIHMLTSSEINVSFSTDSATPELRQALKEISRFALPQLVQHKAVICVIGEGIKRNRVLMADILTALRPAGIKIELISYDMTRTNLTMLVSNNIATKIVRLLHQKLFGKRRIR